MCILDRFPASLMLGFFAEAINDQMTIDYDEIEDANLFSINELKSLQHPSISGGFKLPRVDSIARRLVDTWINSFNLKFFKDNYDFFSN